MATKKANFGDFLRSGAEFFGRSYREGKAVDESTLDAIKGLGVTTAREVSGIEDAVETEGEEVSDGE